MHCLCVCLCQESLKARLAEREQEMDEWRKERDTLVSALEVQLKKLVSTITEKDEQIRELKHADTLQPPEVTTAHFNIITPLPSIAERPTCTLHAPLSTSTLALPWDVVLTVKV